MEHATCTRHLRDSSRRPPTRLIAVGKFDSPEIRLQETAKLEKPIYTTLSHCWGGKVPLRLLSHNHQALLNEISPEDLPKTFLHAVTVTRKLGIPYLWIDSLCIIQDSASDWEAESNRMCDVYRGSYLNIAASASSNSAGGLFYPGDSFTRVPCYISVSTRVCTEEMRTEYISEIESEEDSPLFDRAWVFQGRLLAPRTIFFASEEIYWHCNETHASETFPENLEWDPSTTMTLVRSWQEIELANSERRWELWNEVIKGYSGKKLTEPRDNLVAVAGVASELSKAWPSVRYLAGLWSYRLLQDMFWKCGNGVRTKDRRAPSWSWASIDGDVDPYSRLYLRAFESLSKILEVNVECSSQSNPFGTIKDGNVRIKGPLWKGQIRKLEGSLEVDNWELEMYAGYEELRVYAGDEAECATSLLRLITAIVTWDERWVSETVRAAVVFAMPFEKYRSVGGAMGLKVSSWYPHTTRKDSFSG